MTARLMWTVYGSTRDIGLRISGQRFSYKEGT